MVIEIFNRDVSGKRGEFYIQKAIRTGGLLMVKADWCGHCRRALPILENLSKKLGNSYPVYKLDADSNSQTVKSLGVQGFPTIFYVERDGKIGGIYGGNRDIPSFLDGICKKALVCKK